MKYAEHIADLVGNTPLVKLSSVTRDPVGIACTVLAKIEYMPATGRAFDYRQMHLLRMRGDRGAEHWAVRDDAALHRQLTGENG